jgi:hypothetical protein
VLEIRNVDSRLHIARKARYHDEWDPAVEPCDPYGSGDAVTALTSATLSRVAAWLRRRDMPSTIEEAVPRNVARLLVVFPGEEDRDDPSLVPSDTPEG